jgi:hypothetical protein
VNQPVSGNQRAPKSKGKPVQRTAKQEAAIEKQREREDLAVQQTRAKERAAQLAQVANLMIAGHSIESIAAGIGATTDEVEKMIIDGSARFVRTQPALRAWVRSWISEKYTTMIAADWAAASDVDHPDKLDNQDRVMRMLKAMGTLHGAEAPTQSEVKVEHAPEAVERLVQAMLDKQGQGYDVDIFDDDVVEAEVVDDAPAQALAALEAASKHVEVPDENDEEL